MENNFDQFNNNMAPLPEKPQFLKVLCILSFVGCGLAIICFAFGIMALGLSDEQKNEFWNILNQSQQSLGDIDKDAFFHELGMASLGGLLVNIVSLIGVILMWRLNKVGFFIYAVAELSAHFFSININTAEQPSNMGTVFSVLLDLAFIVMYALNLKYMKKPAAESVA